jgi:precorrin-2 methylase
MTVSATPWTGTWTELSDSLASNDELVLMLASRRDCATEAVRDELERIDENFDVDAIYDKNSVSSLSHREQE